MRSITIVSLMTAFLVMGGCISWDLKSDKKGDTKQETIVTTQHNPIPAKVLVELAEICPEVGIEALVEMVSTEKVALVRLAIKAANNGNTDVANKILTLAFDSGASQSSKAIRQGAVSNGNEPQMGAVFNKFNQKVVVDIYELTPPVNGVGEPTSTETVMGLEIQANSPSVVYLRPGGQYLFVASQGDPAQEVFQDQLSPDYDASDAWYRNSSGRRVSVGWIMEIQPRL